MKKGPRGPLGFYEGGKAPVYVGRLASRPYLNSAFTRPNEVGATAMAVIVMRM